MRLNIYLCLALASIPGLANADILVDRSPDAYSGATLVPSIQGNWANARAGQHFADAVYFNSATTLTGMGIYSGIYWGSMGQTVTISLWADNVGQPGLLLSEFLSTVSSVNKDGASTTADINQKFAQFATPISLAANTAYWIGMSGGDSTTYSELAQLGLAVVSDGSMAVFNGNTYLGLYGTYGDVSMRLYGTLAPIPEPSTYIAGALLLLPFGLQGIRHFRNRKS